MKHLGQVSVQSDQYDRSLLERIERAPRRQGYMQMYGYDVWTVYEFSYLTASGSPVYKILRIITDCNNPYIFESKSLKLYLNSFNNSCVYEPIVQIQKDLETVAGGRVTVVEVQQFESEQALYGRSNKLTFTACQSEYNSNILKTVSFPYHSSQNVYTDLLRTRCEITGAPDFARCLINVINDNKKVDEESLLNYIVSYRNKQEFHEPTCERIFQDLYKALTPVQLMVICQYTRRGGIDINPIRSLKPIDRTICFDLPKLIQQ